MPELRLADTQGADDQGHTPSAAPSGNEPLRILIVTAMYPHTERPGSGAFVMHQVEALRALGHRVDVLHFPGYRSKLEYLKAAFAVASRTRRERYSVVHAHYGLTGLVSLFRSAPLVLTVHGSDALVGRFEPAITRWVSRLADATIVVSDTIAQRVPGEKIPCGVDLSTFTPQPRADARRRLGLLADKKYVIFPFDPARSIKRFDLASAAIQQLTARGISVELLTVWEVHSDEMPWYYSAADAMILCSDSEASPTSIKEALACNVPVVSVNVGDVSEILKGIAGTHIVGRSPEALACGLEATLQPAPGFVFDGRTSMQRYNQRETAEAIVEVYRRAIAGNLVAPERSKHRSNNSE